MWKLYEIHISVSINKALLEHSHDHLFTYYLWLVFLDILAELSGCNRLYGLQTEYFPSSFYKKKSLPADILG